MASRFQRERQREERQHRAAPTIAVDQSQDGARFVAVTATSEEPHHVTVPIVTPLEPELWGCVNERMTDDRRLLLVVGAALEVHVPAEWESRYVTFGTAEIAKWTTIVGAMVKARRVSHDGNPMLAEQVSRAVAAPSYGGAMTLSSQKSPVPIELARCMVAAVALASKPPAKKRGHGGYPMGQAR